MTTRPTFRDWLDATLAETGIDQLEADRDRHLAEAEVLADRIAEAGDPRPDVGQLVQAARQAGVTAAEAAAGLQALSLVEPSAEVQR